MYQEFKVLAQHKQWNLVRSKGIFLMSYRQYNVKIRLYQVDNFYVEVYSFDEDGKIAMINAFQDTKYLDPYLEKLDVSGLMLGN